MNKKGSIASLFVWMIAAFIFALLAAVFLLGFGILTESLIGIDSSDNSLNLNISDAATKTFGKLNQGFQQLKWWTFMLILAMAMSIIISNAIIKVNPVFFVFYVIVVVIAIVVAIILSVTHQGLVAGQTLLGAELQGFTATNWIFAYLPLWITIIGLLGGVFQFVNFGRIEDQGGSIV